jgi:transposase-like protein
MAHQQDDTVLDVVMQLLIENGFDGLADIFRILINEAMKAERSHVLKAQPHQRTPDRTGYANGFKDKTVTTRLGAIPLKVPQVRGNVQFYPSSLERGLRSERAVKLAVAEMYVQGVSTRRVTQVMQQLCGCEVSSTQVSRAAALLDEELGQWRQRPLDVTPYLVLDARYEKIRRGGCVVSCAVLIAVGIGEDGKRSVLGVSVSTSEAETHWRDFLDSLMTRGMKGVRHVTSDDHAGLKAALNARLPGVPWQRCQCHLQRNAQAHIPKVAMRAGVARDLRDVFDAPDRIEADGRLQRYVAHYRDQGFTPLADWMEENVPESLTVFVLPPQHRRKLRTTNMLEGLNKQIKRRTSVAGLFPNEASALRLVSAVVMEISEEWETGKVYLSMDIKAQEND